MLRGVVVLLAFLAATAHPGRAQSDSARTASVALRGIATVTVVIADLPPEASRISLFAVQLRTDVELRLRRAGLRVLPEEDAPGRLPYVFVQVNLTPEGNGMQAWSVDVSLDQAVSILRMPILTTYAPTWQATSRLGFSPRDRVAERVRAAVTDEVDEFLNAWLGTNPPR